MKLTLTTLLFGLSLSAMAQTFVDHAPVGQSQLTVVEETLSDGTKYRRLLEFVPGRGRNEKFGLNENGELLNVWDDNTRRLVYEAYRNWSNAPAKVKKFVSHYRASQFTGSPNGQSSNPSSESDARRFPKATHDTVVYPTTPVEGRPQSDLKTVKVDMKGKRRVPHEPPYFVIPDPLANNIIHTMTPEKRDFKFSTALCGDANPRKHGPNPRRNPESGVGFYVVDESRKFGEMTTWNCEPLYTTKGFINFESYSGGEITFSMNGVEKSLNYKNFVPPYQKPIFDYVERAKVYSKIDPKTGLSKPIAAVLGVHVGKLVGDTLKNEHNGFLIVKIGDSADDTCIVAGAASGIGIPEVERRSGERVTFNEQDVSFYTGRQLGIKARAADAGQLHKNQLLAAVERGELTCDNTNAAQIREDFSRSPLEHVVRLPERSAQANSSDRVVYPHPPTSPKPQQVLKSVQVNMLGQKRAEQWGRNFIVPDEDTNNAIHTLQPEKRDFATSTGLCGDSNPTKHGANPQRGERVSGYKVVDESRKFGEVSSWNCDPLHTAKGHINFEQYDYSELTFTMNGVEKALGLQKYVPQLPEPFIDYVEKAKVYSKTDPATGLPKPYAAVMKVFIRKNVNHVMKLEHAGVLVMKIGDSVDDSCIVGGAATEINNAEVIRRSGEKIVFNSQDVAFFTEKQLRLKADAINAGHLRRNQLLAAVERGELTCTNTNAAEIQKAFMRSPLD